MKTERTHKITAIVNFTGAALLLALIALGITLGWGMDRLWGSFAALPILGAQGITHTYLLGKARR